MLELAEYILDMVLITVGSHPALRITAQIRSGDADAGERAGEQVG
jgi:hypothetical protein